MGGASRKRSHSQNEHCIKLRLLLSLHDSMLSPQIHGIRSRPIYLFDSIVYDTTATTTTTTTKLWKH